MKVFAYSGKGLLGVLALSTLVWAGCGGSQDSPPAEGDQAMSAAAQPMSEEVQELVNRGNEAQRAGDFDGALVLYQEAMALDPEHPVPQFGALMVAKATGDDELAESLSQRLQETSPELLAMLNPSGGMGGEMPANPHAEGGVPGAMPPVPEIEGGTPIEDLPTGHPTLYDMGPADTTQPDTTGGR